MKRSEMLIKMQRVYGIRHVMVEGGYITVADFMDELLTYMEQTGMEPPFRKWEVVRKGFFFTPSTNEILENPIVEYAENSWEPESTIEQKIFETWRPG
jgi:hypothetical protein